MSPSVDIVIPTYNGTLRIERAVRSAIAEAISIAADFVLIAVDDGSSDGSPELLQELAATEPRMRVLVNRNNLGIPQTRNRAIRSGTAEFVAFLDQDDEWIPGSLGRRIDALTSEPALGFVVSSQVMKLDKGQARPPWCRPEWLDRPVPGYLPSTLVARRRAFVDLGLFDESYRSGGDDAEWFARARTRHTPHLMLEEPAVVRYVHDRNASADPRLGRDLLSLVRRYVQGEER